MAEEDIYGNKVSYEKFINNLDDITNPNIEKKKYYCKNKGNLIYFKQIIRYCEVEDLSYIRRLSILRYLKFLTFYTDCDLKDLNGIDRETI